MDKRMYIYNHISLLKNHDNFIRILTDNNCNYTKNNNGIFVNLTTISEIIIDKLFFILECELQNGNQIDDDRNIYIQENIEKNKGRIITKSKTNPKDFTKLYLKDFQKKEREIIVTSKETKL